MLLLELIYYIIFNVAYSKQMYSTDHHKATDNDCEYGTFKTSEGTGPQSNCPLCPIDNPAQGQNETSNLGSVFGQH